MLSVRGIHFGIWCTLLVVLPIIAARKVHRTRPDATGRIFGDVLGPVLIGLLWLHACWLSPPNNWAVLDRFGFIRFWFCPRWSDGYYYGRHIGAYLQWSVAALVPFALAIAAFVRKRPAAEQFELRYAGFAFAAIFLWFIPNSMLDLHDHYSTAYNDLDRAFDIEGAKMFRASVLACIGLVTAWWQGWTRPRDHGAA